MKAGAEGIRTIGRRIGKMRFAVSGGVVQWFPGHMFAATRVIRERLKLADLVIEVRDARIPLSSANEDLQNVLSHKRRIIALNKKDLANPNMMHHWIRSFDSKKQDCIAVNALSKHSVSQLLALAELKLKEVSSKDTMLVMVVGVPNVGKSALINSIHQIAVSRFPVQEKIKRATVGRLPGVTQDIAGFKISNRPSIYVLDTPGILVPRIHDIETGLKLALTGAVKDSAVGEERLAQYLLAILNIRKTPLHWNNLMNSAKQSDGSSPELVERVSSIFGNSFHKRRKALDVTDIMYVEGLVKEVMYTLFTTLSEYDGDLDDDACLESLIDIQLMSLQKPLKVVHKSSEVVRTMVSKKLLTLFRTGKLGPFILDDVSEAIM
ncbi:Ribosome biogenesis GTPase A [Zostera marina]|uniref:Ribosome biogenesis GTPase A n=1 Tax=Zostera marina TaxID=29655 RepID=A0A0K9NMV2_ZOSMR|nr:Ribosome biogenesis GTPase A [Zostera marina]